MCSVDQRDSVELSGVRQTAVVTAVTHLESRAKDIIMEHARKDHRVSDAQIQQVIDRHQTELARMKEKQEEERARQLAALEDKLAAMRRTHKVTNNTKKPKSASGSPRVKPRSQLSVVSRHKSLELPDLHTTVHPTVHPTIHPTIHPTMPTSLRQQLALQEKLTARQQRRQHAVDSQILAGGDPRTAPDPRPRACSVPSKAGQEGGDPEGLRAAVRDRVMEREAQAVEARLGKLEVARSKDMAAIEDRQHTIGALRMAAEEVGERLEDGGSEVHDHRQSIMEHYEEQQTKLASTLVGQRKQQEEELKKKLRHRLVQQEKLLDALQTTGLADIDKLPQEMVAQVRKISLVDNHPGQLQLLRHDLMQETEQEVRQLREQLAAVTREAVERREEHVAVGLCHLSQAAPGVVVQTVFPDKTADLRRQLTTRVQDGVDRVASAPLPAAHHQQKAGNNGTKHPLNVTYGKDRPRTTTAVTKKPPKPATNTTKKTEYDKQRQQMHLNRPRTVVLKGGNKHGKKKK